MRIAYDLDGTFYDALKLIYSVYNSVGRKLGYPAFELQKYRENFQSKDWRLFCRSNGVREEHIDDFITTFVAELATKEPPHLIPGAREVIQKSSELLGDNMYIITNEPFPRVKQRFERDGLEELLPMVHSPYQGKAKELFSIAAQAPEAPLLYVGDLASDGESCKDAREMGANNLRFYGIVHEYSFNPDYMVHAFVNANKEFCGIISGVQEIPRLWNGLHK